MSQYDFGVIDPTVRDGSWLADALNQWRDSLYSMSDGPAAPAYAVDGLLWRDTSNGTAKTSIRQRQNGVWKELWSFDSAGNVSYSGIDWSNITQQAIFKASPVAFTAVNRAHFQGAPSITTDGAIGIGTVSPQAALHARFSGYVSAIVETTGSIAAGQSNGALLYLVGPEQKWDFRNWNGGVLEIWDDTVGRAVISLQKQGTLTVFGNSFLEHVLYTTANDQSRTAWRNANRIWIGGNIANEFQVWDLTAGGKRFAIDSSGNVHTSNCTGGSAYTYANALGCGYATFSQQIDVANWVSCKDVRGGVNNAGTLLTWGEAHKVCFRWGNNVGANQLIYRVDEAIDIGIPNSPVSGSFNAYRGSNITTPAGGAWAWMFFSTTTSACNAGVSPGGTFLDFGSMGNIILWKVAN